MECDTKRAMRVLVGAMVLGALCSGCAADDELACTYEVCEPADPACLERTAEVVACRLGRDPVVPSFRVTTGERLAAEVSLDPEWVALLRDVYRAESFMKLAPSDVDPEAGVRERRARTRGYYSFVDEEIVLVEDAPGMDDRERRYTVLVHELVHASQDVEVDLSAFDLAFGTTRDRWLAARSVAEGEAELYETHASIELAGYGLLDIDRQGYFENWQDDSVEHLTEGPTATLDAGGVFPYPWGGGFALRAWDVNGPNQVRALFDNPLPSTRSVMAGFGPSWKVVNRDVEVDQVGVPRFAGDAFEPLGVRHQGTWMAMAFLAQHGVQPWELVSAGMNIAGDVFSIHRISGTSHVVAVWRIRGKVPGTIKGWPSELDQATTRYRMRIGGDTILVATPSDVPVSSVVDSIEGWQPTRDVFAHDIGHSPPPATDCAFSPHARFSRLR